MHMEGGVEEFKYSENYWNTKLDCITRINEGVSSHNIIKIPVLPRDKVIKIHLKVIDIMFFRIRMDINFDSKLPT